MSDETVTLTLRRDEAIVLDASLDRMFGNYDLHDWELVKFSFEQECEQWPFQAIRDALSAQLVTVNTAADYNLILDNARKSVSAHQWGE